MGRGLGRGARAGSAAMSILGRAGRQSPCGRRGFCNSVQDSCTLFKCESRGTAMPNPLDGVDTSNAPVRDRVVGHPRRAAGRGVPRRTSSPRFHPQFDEWVGDTPPAPAPGRGGQRRVRRAVGGRERGGAHAAPSTPTIRDKDARRRRHRRRGDLRRRRLGHRPGVAAVRRRARGRADHRSRRWPSPAPGPTTGGWSSSAPPTRSAAPASRSCRSSTTSSESVARDRVARRQARHQGRS